MWGLDAWRCLYAVTILLLSCAASSQAPLVAVAAYSRYAAAAALAVYTWTSTRTQAQPLSAQSRSVRQLITSLWCLVLVAYATALWSVDVATTLQQSTALAIFVFLLHALATRRWSDRTVIPGDLAVAFFVLTTTFLGAMGWNALGLPGSRSYSGRFQGLYANPNTLANVAALTFLLGLGLFLLQRRVVYLVGSATTLTAMVLTESRTALVAVVVGLLVTVLAGGVATTVRVLYAGSLLTALTLLFTPSLGLSAPVALLATFRRFQANEGGDLLNSRTEAWRAAVELWQARPLTGYGYQAGEELFTSRYDVGLLEFSRPSAHSSYLQLLLELGLVGVLVTLPALSALVRVWTARGGDGFDAGLRAVVGAGILIQITESAMFGTGQAYPYVLWLAVLAVLLRREVRIGPVPMGSGSGRRSAGHRLVPTARRAQPRRAHPSAGSDEMVPPVPIR